MDDEFLKKLMTTFMTEAGEHIHALSSGLIKLETPTTREARIKVLESIFREAHSLKGAARTVNMSDIEKLCHAMESVIAAMKRGEIDAAPPLLDLLHKTADGLERLLAEAGAAGPPGNKFPIADLVAGLESAATGRTVEAAETSAEVKRAAPRPEGTIRVSSARLSSLLVQAEELLAVKQASERHSADLRGTLASLDQWTREWERVRPRLQPLRRTQESREGLGPSGAGLLEFLDWSQEHMRSMESRSRTLAAEAERDRRLFGRMVDDLLDNMRGAAMLPVSSAVAVFPKLVHDLCRDRGKEADLIVLGGDVDVDRRILEELGDPLIHIVRNCIDHGIEKPGERKARGKPSRGKITLAVSRSGTDKVEITVADDGAGIDAAKVKEAALKLGAVFAEEVEGMEESDALLLVFRSGVTLSPMITDISGRGLGLAIVKEKLEKLGGDVSVESSLGAGATFRLVAPLTLAVFKGILVESGGQALVIPLAGVERVVRIRKDEVRTVENRRTIELFGRTVPFTKLDDVLGLPARQEADGSGEFVSALVLASTGTRIAVGVDGIVGEQEFLVKSLNPLLSPVRHVTGAALLTSGSVVPVLSVPELVKSAAKSTGRPEPAVRAAEAAGKSILVAEDSITARTLLRNILESAGYRVRTAVDGLDAFSALRTESFDLVVSDVDMPRMNGFELTARIRADKKLSELPVVLVTALESSEDRGRGLDAGANAYIVKSGFDQGNLLEIIRRLA